MSSLVSAFGNLPPALTPEGLLGGLFLLGPHTALPLLSFPLTHSWRLCDGGQQITGPQSTFFFSFFKAYETTFLAGIAVPGHRIFPSPQDNSTSWSWSGFCSFVIPLLGNNYILTWRVLFSFISTRHLFSMCISLDSFAPS